jgi:ribosomal-protein-alanine N-acetyltransferase
MFSHNVYIVDKLAVVSSTIRSECRRRRLRPDRCHIIWERHSTAMELQTPNLTLIPKTREEALAQVAEMPAGWRAEVSPVWLARVQSMTTPDPWTLGFTVFHRGLDTAVGGCGFKGPPNHDGTVEIAYGIDAVHQGNGYATEVAEALVAYAFRDPRVRIVMAHTLSATQASARVLTKSRFRCVGQVLDPEDGEVWRWERTRDGEAAS